MGRKVVIDNLGIPSLAGICDHERACRTGLSVEAAVDWLKRFVYLESRMNEVFAANIPRTPEWEVKCALGLHAWLDAEHSSLLRERVAEMRNPPLHLNRVPDDRLEDWLEEVIRAQDSVELLAGVYRVVKPALVRSMERYLEESNPLADHPTYRILKWVIQEEKEMIAWGEQAILALSGSTEAKVRGRHWEEHLRAYLVAAGGVLGDQDSEDPASLPDPRSDGTPYQMDAVPCRDGRFEDHFNPTGDKVDDLFKDEEKSYDERVMSLFSKRLREMDVPEWIAPIIYNTRDKPWGYYADMSRQLWDETRHAMLGEVGYYHKGIPFYEYPVNMAASYALNTRFTPFEAHVILWGIEQDLMPRKTGKGYEWDVAVGSGDEFAILMQDYDWADEVLHARIGRRWLLSEVGSREELKALAVPLIERWLDEIEELSAQSSGMDWWRQLMSRVERNT